MSIEQLESMQDSYSNEVHFGNRDKVDIIANYLHFFITNIILILKDQSDMIADLRKELAETKIDYNNIKIGGE